MILSTVAPALIIVLVLVIIGIVLLLILFFESADTTPRPKKGSRVDVAPDSDHLADDERVIDSLLRNEQQASEGRSGS